MSEEAVLEDMKDFYGKLAQNAADCNNTTVSSTACQRMPRDLLKLVKLVHEEVLARYLGCGLVTPDKVEGCKVMDLGCGSGRDCYIISKLVGENGHVTGIDMTEELIEVARKYIDYHTELFGYKKPNVDFKTGYIEKMGEAGIPRGEYDVLVSNCVVNLTPNKKAVLKEAFNALKVGGEFYFSDMYRDKVLPEHIRYNKVLWGEGLGGALAWTELVQLAEDVGFSEPRLVKASPIDVINPEMQKILAGYRYASATYRLVKLPDQHRQACQVTYKGSVQGAEEEFTLDYATKFKVNETVPADAEIATILQCSRYHDDFTFQPCDKSQVGAEKKHNPNPFDLCDAGSCAPCKSESGCS